MKKTHYYGIDYLRAIACIGILMMHVQANIGLKSLRGFIFESLIPSFTNFVFLFMAVSAFGMCIGYFDKVSAKEVDWTDFYKKRYLKILPFFAILVIIDLVMSHAKAAFIEGFTDVTLLFGLFPNNISVIGVGWFLGVVFAFYLIFPFFCFLIHNRLMAWISFAVSLVLNYFCVSYYNVGRTNIVYCLPFFISGGLVFLYKDLLTKIKWYVFMPFTAVSVVVYFWAGGNVYTCLFTSICLLIQALLIPFGNKSAVSKLFIFISGISMEIYLSHMLVYRALEKIHLNSFIKNDLLQYFAFVLMVFAGAVIFSFIMQKILKRILNKFGV